MVKPLRLDCKTRLDTLFVGTCSGLECLDYLTVLLIAADKGPLGRKLISRSTGMGEKRVRRIAEKLRELGLVRGSKAGIEADVAGVYCVEKGERTIALVSCNKGHASEYLRRVIELRDRIVIALASPTLLEVIGYVDSNTVEIPFVDNEALRLYTEVLKPLGKLEECIDGCIAAVFGRPGCYRCCASLLHALTASG